ncbi:MAG TPA: ATP-binding protein, partial [Desulfurivibrionaceae bacterium]|nr:ATP-binding protein [Desulfurivibrionaceae bacterium]
LRTLNSLVVEVRDQGELLQRVCDTLVGTHRYHHAWIALLDAEQRLVAIAEAGLTASFDSFAEQLAAGWRPECVERVMVGPEPVVVTNDPANTCPACPLAPAKSGLAGIVARLEHEGVVYGILSVSVPGRLGRDQEEVAFFREIARDVGQALCHRRLKAERQKAEEAMRRQMHELFAIFNAIEGAVYVADMQTYEILAITASEKEFGQSLVGRKCYESLQKGQHAPCDFCTNDRLIGPDGTPNPPVVWEFQNTRTNRWYLCIDRAIHWPDGRLVRMEIAIDITDRKRAEERLSQSEKSLREMVDNSLVGIMLLQDCEIIYQNPEQRRLFGTLPRGYRLEDFQGVHPEDLPKLAESYRQVTHGEVSQVDVDFRYYPVRGQEGASGQMKWVYCRARPIDYQGKKTLLVSMMDMSHARELERLVLVQEKMSSLGRVAAGIAHEIRNPLSGINIYLNTLEKIHNRPGREAMVQDIFRQLYTASEKIESVIRRVMDFSRPGQPHFAKQAVNGPVEEMMGLCAVTLRKSGVTLEAELGAELPLCRFDAHLITQVLMNLLANSAEAMKKQVTAKRVRVRTERSGRFVLIRVADSGPGVPAAVRDKVFDPYYTTKADGTGIGLSISHRIVSDHGGRLTVSESDLGGAEFVIALPVEEEAAG